MNFLLRPVVTAPPCIGFRREELCAIINHYTRYMKPKGGNLINSPCCDDEILIKYGSSNFAFIDYFECKKCGQTLELKPLEVRKNW